MYYKYRKDKLAQFFVYGVIKKLKGGISYCLTCQLLNISQNDFKTLKFKFMFVNLVRCKLVN